MSNEVNFKRRVFLRRFCGIAVMILSPWVWWGGTASADDDGKGHGKGHSKVRWDIPSIDPIAGTVSPGGVASARANDGSKITLTGFGTFRVGDDSEHVTGGGTWETFNTAGNSTGKGRFKVTGLVRWEKAPGTLPPLTDLIGDRDEAGAGLAVLRIRYSDRSRGILVVSCHLVGTPDSVFEGITASKGFVDFWNREAPSDNPFVNANRTLFHVGDNENENEEDEDQN